MRIRLAKSSDLDAIVEILNQAILARVIAETEPVTVANRRPWFDDHAPERRPILVAESAVGVLGWASLGDYRPPRQALRHTAEVSYFVHRDHRRRGVGSALVRACVERCPELGIKTLLAILLGDNAGSLRLLESLGFERWGVLPRVADFDGREDDHLYYGLRVG